MNQIETINVHFTHINEISHSLAIDPLSTITLNHVNPILSKIEVSIAPTLSSNTNPPSCDGEIERIDYDDNSSIKIVQARMNFQVGMVPGGLLEIDMQAKTVKLSAAGSGLPFFEIMSGIVL